MVTPGCVTITVIYANGCQFPYSYTFLLVPIAKPPVMNPILLVPASLDAISVKLRYTQLFGMFPSLLM